MQKHRQLNRHDPDNGILGDCLRTAVGCVLNLEPQCVPHFSAEYETDEECFEALRVWLRGRGLDIIGAMYGDGTPNITPKQVMAAVAANNPDHYYLLSGESRTGVNHVVVCLGDRVVHDPAQDSSGIVGPQTEHGYYAVEFIVGHDARFIGNPQEAEG